ncbi:MAG: MBL fold metallo-hydrolase [Oscillospiraceae bacterium]
MAKRKKYNKQKRIIGILSSALIIVSTILLSVVLDIEQISFAQIAAIVDSFLEDPDKKEQRQAAQGELAVTIIDVGQGESIFIEANDKNVLIDAGENDCEQLVVDFLKDKKVESLDLVIGTHPHSDHIGGLDSVIRQIETKMVLLPPMSKSQTPTTKTFEDVLLAIDETQTQLITSKPGQVFNFGGGSILTIIGPQKEYDDLNNISIVSRLDFGEVSFLFTGDAEEVAEKDMIFGKYDLDVDILSAGHHGSSTSTSSNFFQKCSPSHVNISCGLNNKYNHPHMETLKILDETGTPYCRTDLNGNITYITDGKTYEVICEKENAA